MIYQFNQARIDSDHYHLTLMGRPVAVEPLVFDLLVYLISNRDRVVAREELLDKLWEGKVVTDAALGTRIKDARNAVGDSGRKQAVIKTYYGRGYQFIAEVTESTSNDSWLDSGSLAGGPESIPFPGNPSIAVLPFVDLSGDPEQAHFGDGITDEIVTALSRIGDLIVIALNLTVDFSDEAANIRSIAHGLGIRYIVDGSVKKSGQRIRVNARLVDATTGQQVWSDRYDRTLVDLLDLQDEITQVIVTALQVRLTEGEQARLWGRQTKSLQAWECFIRGQSVFRGFNKHGNMESRALFMESIDLDPDFAAAWLKLAWTHVIEARLGWSDDADASLEQAAGLCEKSLNLDNRQPDAHALMGAIRLLQRSYEAAITNGRTGIELGPSVADAHILLAQTLNYMDEPQEASELIQKSMRLSPFYPAWYLSVLGVNYRMLGRYQEAIAADLQQLQRNPENNFSNYRLAALYMEAGEIEEARKHIREVRRKNPEASLGQVRFCEPYQDGAKLEHHVELLRKAGLPE